MAIQIAENLWLLEIPLVNSPLKNLNSYLITGKRNLLIDTGFRQESCREAMERELDHIGVDRSKMDIFLTHLHSDHTGLAPELIYPHCHIFISSIDGQRLSASYLESTWRKLYAENIREGFSAEEVEWLWANNPAQNGRPIQYDDYIYLSGGDEFSYGGITLQTLHTPGHTPGHLCLYAPQKQWLFSGDHILFHITPNICRWEGVPDSLGDYLNSLAQIRSLPVRLLLPAHRHDTGNFSVRTNELEIHHIQRITEVLDIVKHEPGLTAYQIAGRMAWSIRSQNWDDFPTTQKHFAVGEAMAHLDYLISRMRVERRDANAQFRYYAINP